MRRGVIVFVLLVSGAAGAMPPPEPCVVETRSQSGYIWGALYAGFFAKPEACARFPFVRGLTRFPLMLLASALVQADVGTAEAGLRRARLSVTARLWRRVALVVSGDAAERSVPDAYLSLSIMQPPAVVWPSDSTFDLAVLAGHRVVPFGLENAWSDAKLPFLEHATATATLAPEQRQDGVSVAAARMRPIDPPLSSSDTGRTLTWYAEAGVFQPFDERDSVAAIGRAFVRYERENTYNNLVAYLHLGVSGAFGRRRASASTLELAPDGRERALAAEVEARYRRVTVTGELLAATQDVRSQRTGMREIVRGDGATLTIAMTLPIDRYRWWTEPLRRDPVPSVRHVDRTDSDGPNPGLEIDLGIDALRADTASSTKVRVAAHLYVHDFAKLSCAYAYTTESRSHELIARLQLAL